NEAAVIGRSATDPNHRKRQRPTVRLGAGAHVEPAERTVTVYRDAFERMGVARLPAVVVSVVVGARPAHGLICLAIQIDGAGGAGILDCQEQAVSAPGLVIGIVVPGVRAPCWRTTRAQSDAPPRIAGDAGHLEVERL